MQKYLVIIEKAKDGYSAFSPDVSGCFTVGDTIEETIDYMKEALELYLESVIEDGLHIPEPKGLKYHIDAGIFDEGQIADEYYIAQLEVKLPKVAA